jgi:5'-nucleotidase
MTEAPPGRGVFCNRTLNMKSIKAIGYDMDYTLIHYHAAEWERRAHDFMRQRLAAKGWPVGELRFDPTMVVRGLVIDVEHGNILKPNRFGLVRKAMHGTRALTFEEQRVAYARTFVELSEPRWVFLNSLFSLSEGCLYAQLVDLLDKGVLPGPMGYRELYAEVAASLSFAHVEGELKAEIMADPARFVDLDPGTPLALLDQKHAGKKLLLITNSEWAFTGAMMSYTFDRYLPPGTTWRDLFDVVIVGARKPDFFTGQAPFFEVVSPDGLLRPLTSKVALGGSYLGGSAARLERDLGFSGDELLYVGDHMFGDVRFTKRVLRWRTALVLRELEDEVQAIAAFGETELVLGARMREKEDLETHLAQLRLALQRRRAGYATVAQTEDEIDEEIAATKAALLEMDAVIAPLAKATAEISHPAWGLLTRAGNDKSHLARQIERHADIYTSRVSNLAYTTPFMYLRAPRGSLPHDPVSPGATPTGPDPA